MGNISKRLLAIGMCSLMAIPFAVALADSTGKVGEATIFNALGTGTSISGGTNTDVEQNQNDNSSSVNTSADKQNISSNADLKNNLDKINGQPTDSSSIVTDGSYIQVDNIKVNISDLNKFLEQANYTKNGKYGYADTSDKNPHEISIDDAHKQMLADFINNGAKGELEEGGTKISNEPMTPIKINGSRIPNIVKPNSDIDPNDIADIITILKDKGYIITLPDGTELLDNEFLGDRYDNVKEFLNGVSITDTVNVQHIIEYSVKSVSTSTLYKREQIDIGGGLYHWTIKCLDADDASYIGRIEEAGTPTGTFIKQFGAPGTYEITATEHVIDKYVDTITFDINEYWVLADSGQVLYKKLSHGKFGDNQSVAGRVNDKNTLYYNMTIDTNQDSPDGTYGHEIYHTIHKVTADMLEGVFPATGVFDKSYNTARIE